MTTIIGAFSSGRDDSPLNILRGSSETWQQLNIRHILAQLLHSDAPLGEVLMIFWNSLSIDRRIMRRISNREFWLSLLAMVIIGGIYIVFVWQTKAIPAAAGLFGHLLGIIGFIMMLMTEIFYSLRKRSKLARWGRMSDWLEFHIFTGLVGPYMVLLHTSWKFNGLAGLVTLLTIIIVASGFVGRYIFTRIPRSVEGVELESPAGESQRAALARARKALSTWYAIHIPIGITLFVTAFFHITGALYYATLLH